MCTFLTVILSCPVGVWAAGNGETVSSVPVWLCIPFAGLLLCVAVMPLVKGEWWESHQPIVVAFWIVLMVIPFAFVYGAGKTAETVLECVINDYLTFIILLFGLFCVSGNITVEGDFAGSPRVNVGLLALDGASGDQNEFLEKEKRPHYDLFHFYGVKHGWLPDTDR